MQKAERTKQIAKLMLSGVKRTEIAKHIGITPKTLDNFCSHVGLKKTTAQSFLTNESPQAMAWITRRKNEGKTKDAEVSKPKAKKVISVIERKMNWYGIEVVIRNNAITKMILENDKRIIIS